MGGWGVLSEMLFVTDVKHACIQRKRYRMETLLKKLSLHVDRLHLDPLLTLFLELLTFATERVGV